MESGAQKHRPAFGSAALLIISQITSIRFEVGEKHLAVRFCYATAVWLAPISDKLRGEMSMAAQLVRMMNGE